MIESGKRPRATLVGIAAILLAGATVVHAQDLRIGLAAPLSGSFAPLGKQMAEGARVAATAKNAALTTADDRCDAQGGAEAAQRFVDAKVQAAAGFLCFEALEAALPILNAHGIPVVVSGVAERTLAERRAASPLPVFRLSTGLDRETRATASFLGSLWRAQPFAVIDDGTMEGRERASRVLARLKEQQLQPVFTDTYRPGLDNQNALAARLKRAGASHVYVGGQRDDVAALGASAAALNIPLEIAGGGLLDAAPGATPLAPGTLMIAPLAPQDLPTAQAAVAALRKAGVLADAFAVTGYATAEVAADALAEAQKRKQPVTVMLRDLTFETALGTIKFGPDGMRADNPNRLQRFDGRRFVLADK